MIDDERQLAALRAIHERRLDVFVHHASKASPTIWILTDKRYVDGRPGRGMGPTVADALDDFKPAERAYGKTKRRRADDCEDEA